MYRALRYARALAAHGNYRRAARALGISQSQLSRAIQSLEEEFGVELFLRSRQGVRIAPEGALVLDEAAVLLKAEDVFAARVAKIRDQSKQEFRLGVAAFASQSWMSSAITALTHSQPAALISISELDWWKLADAAVSDDFHLVVGECTEAEQNPDVIVERFPERRAGFFVRAGHKLDGHNPITLDQIAQFPLAGPRLPSRIGQFVPAGTKLGHVSEDGRFFLPMIEIAAPKSIADVAMASNAVCITLREMCAEQLASGALVELPLHPPWLCTRQGIMYRRGRSLSDAALAFRAKARVAERRYFRRAAAS